METIIALSFLLTGLFASISSAQEEQKYCPFTIRVKSVKCVALKTNKNEKKLVEVSFIVMASSRKEAIQKTSQKAIQLDYKVIEVRNIKLVREEEIDFYSYSYKERMIPCKHTQDGLWKVSLLCLQVKHPGCGYFDPAPLPYFPDFDCKRTSFLETPPTLPKIENQEDNLLSYKPSDWNEHPQNFWEDIFEKKQQPKIEGAIITKIEENRPPEGCILPPQIGGEIVSLEISSKVSPRWTDPKPEYPNQTKPNKKSRRGFDENNPFDPRYTDPAPTQPSENKEWPKECESCTMPNLIFPGYWEKQHQNCKCECHKKKIWAKSQPPPIPINSFIERGDWSKVPPQTQPYFPHKTDNFFFFKKKKDIGCDRGFCL